MPRQANTKDYSSTHTTSSIPNIHSSNIRGHYMAHIAIPPRVKIGFVLVEACRQEVFRRAEPHLVALDKAHAALEGHHAANTDAVGKLGAHIKALEMALCAETDDVRQCYASLIVECENTIERIIYEGDRINAINTESELQNFASHVLMLHASLFPWRNGILLEPHIRCGPGNSLYDRGWIADARIRDAQRFMSFAATAQVSQARQVIPGNNKQRIVEAANESLRVHLKEEELRRFEEEKAARRQQQHQQQQQLLLTDSLLTAPSVSVDTTNGNEADGVFAILERSNSDEPLPMFSVDPHLHDDDDASPNAKGSPEAEEEKGGLGFGRGRHDSSVQCNDTCAPPEVAEGSGVAMVLVGDERENALTPEYQSSPPPAPVGNRRPSVPCAGKISPPLPVDAVQRHTHADPHQRLSTSLKEGPMGDTSSAMAYAA